MSGAASVSWGKWGGFYTTRRDLAWRVCLGFVALTWWREDIDTLLHRALDTESP